MRLLGFGCRGFVVGPRSSVLYGFAEFPVKKVHEDIVLSRPHTWVPLDSLLAPIPSFVPEAAGAEKSQTPSSVQSGVLHWSASVDELDILPPCRCIGCTRVEASPCDVVAVFPRPVRLPRCWAGLCRRCSPGGRLPIARIVGRIRSRRSRQGLG